jgi:hypothetical protein
MTPEKKTTEFNKKITLADQAANKLARLPQFSPEEAAELQDTVRGLYQEAQIPTPDAGMSIAEVEALIDTLNLQLQSGQISKELATKTAEALWIQHDIALNRPLTYAQRLRQGVRTSISYVNPVEYWNNIRQEGKWVVTLNSATAACNSLAASGFYIVDNDWAMYTQMGLFVFNSALAISNYRKYRITKSSKYHPTSRIV